MIPVNPFIFGVGLMNLGAAVWYFRTASPIMGLSLITMALGAIIQSYAKVS